MSGGGGGAGDAAMATVGAASTCVQVIADNEAGLLFKNKRDRKVRRWAGGCAGLTELGVGDGLNNVES